MKRIATLLAFLTTSVTVMFAQNLSVKGSVYDFDSAEPMYPAAVQIFQISGTDSTYINGTSTEEDGTFVINNLKPGNYVARASFMGYGLGLQTLNSCAHPRAKSAIRHWTVHPVL